ncbi:MAG: putative type pilus biosis protein [Francisellaceae bacterium]|nr:putative type pilus biosis protein [Francisellaceae bacterium]
MSKNQSGISLIEILISLVIILLVSFGTIISGRDILIRQERRYLLNNLEQSFALARSEALKHSKIISICPRLNTIDLKCAYNTFDWSQGFIIFLNPLNLNHPIDNDHVLSTSTSLKYGRLKAEFSVSIKQNHLNFSSEGHFLHNGNFIYCPKKKDYEVEADGLVIFHDRIRRLYNRNSQGVLLKEIKGPLSDPIICY